MRYVNLAEAVPPLRVISLQPSPAISRSPMQPSPAYNSYFPPYARALPSVTVDLQSVRIFHGSVWFVRAIGFAYFLWHGQTIRFHEIFERSVNPLYSGFTERSNIFMEAYGLSVP